MDKCYLCPRNCGVDRNKKFGICNSSNIIKVARASVHMWEEPCISGDKGSGTIFFSGCNLRCVYCQNYSISDGTVGVDVSPERLCEIFFELKDKGVANINLVTGDHYIQHIVRTIESAKINHLDIPIVFNTSSYIKIETLKMLDGLVDVYLPDLKYVDTSISKRYSKAENYFEIAKTALDYMYTKQPKNIFDKDGYIKKGVIVRHLVLPNNILNSKKVIKYLYETYGKDIYMSIMSQFTPVGNVSDYPEINRKLTQKEYSRVLDFIQELGLENVYIQDGESAKESFIPQFDLSGV